MRHGPRSDGSGTEQQANQSEQQAGASLPTGAASAGIREPVAVDIADGLPLALLDDPADAPPSAAAQSDDHTADDATMTTSNPTSDDSRTDTDHTAAHYDGIREPVTVDVAAPVDVLDADPDDGAHMTAPTHTDDDGSTDTEPTLMTDGGRDVPDADEWTPQQDAPAYGGVRSPSKMNWVDAVRAGFTTASTAADAMGKSRPTASKHLNALADDADAPIEAFRDGNSKVYVYDADLVADDTSGGHTTTTTADTDDGGDTTATPDTTDATDPALAAGFPKPLDEYASSMPDYRHTFDFDAQVPTDVPEYHPSGNEMDALNDYAHVLEQVDDPDRIGNPLTLQMVGPTGSGKTHAPEKVAEERGWAYYEITLKDSMDPSDLEGWPNVMQAFTAWIDSTLVEALLCTHDRPTILVLDEVNRAPPAVRSVFMSVLDSRAGVQLESRGGELVAADKSNLLVVSTRNPSDDADYDVYDLDRAQESRLGRRCTVNYLGIDRPDKEADLLVDRQGVSQEWADRAVEAANKVREAAQTTANAGGGLGGGTSSNVSDAEQHIDRGVPTRNLLMMARDAYLAGASGRPGASMYAIRGHLDNDYDGEARDIVGTIFSDKVGGVDPVGDNGNGLLDGIGGGN